MENWSVHHLYQKAEETLGQAPARSLQEYAARLKAQQLPVIFSLGHLSRITKIKYSFLYSTINRHREISNYNIFWVRKRAGGKRYIHAVNGKLFHLQKFINDEILQMLTPHHSSFAFHASGGIRKCAAMHCGCKWIFQFDLKDFFYSITEPQVFKVFKSLGYRDLLSFELSRLCTTLNLESQYTPLLKPNPKFEIKDRKIPYPYQENSGVLPQGAPTSPMLSNLAALDLDKALYNYALKNSFTYTRYADDLTFSSSSLPIGKSIGRIQGEIKDIIKNNGFINNKDKMHISGPGSKKMVLGLLVDGTKPRISRETYSRIERLIYASEKFGLRSTAIHEKFESTYGFYNHLLGLLAFVKDIDSTRYSKLSQQFLAIPKPLEVSSF